ncbi:hypothetical protein MARILYN_39 [Vibrio phage Marilyn]|nr:hypothetical protein MARILYN_39 [Vibrio phage Marilyn]WCD55562.1 hypothetical protein FAYDEN_39 [Vibrio phage Fayden]WCD55619.1 hypothetical protein BAYBAE_39 [Vibrio phage Baybae]WCD55678.1 hypothetical protein VAITEPHAGE_39 [Vibrio phage Vaitephage]
MEHTHGFFYYGALALNVAVIAGILIRGYKEV